MFNVCV
jgi:hypothetical protein